MKKILIISMDRFFARLTALKLLKRGFEVHTVTNMEEVLVKARSIMPDVFVLDEDNATTERREMLTKLKGDEKLTATPVIMLSASGSTDIGSVKTDGVVYLEKSQSNMDDLVDELNVQLA